MRSWQKALAAARITDIDELFTILELPDTAKPMVPARDFALNTTRCFVNRIQKRRMDDPLLLQILPQSQEFVETPGFTEDPLNERELSPTPGILHRYQGRVLLTLTGACPIHCRYCFRRHFPYQDHQPLGQQWQETLKYLTEHTDVEEIILSGGEPLLLTDDKLNRVLHDLANIPHIHRLRIHTRMPIVFPARIHEDFIGSMRAYAKPITMVIHCNHPQEIDTEVQQVLQKLRIACPILNQSVLLAGVNDDAKTLAALSVKLLESGVLPYYLHLLDPVAGAAHFHVDDNTARLLLTELQRQLPGYLVPKFVRTVPNAHHKISL